MSLERAQDLLKLAGILASRYGGITVKDVAKEFSVNERTAQRMIATLKDVLLSISHWTDSEPRQGWTVSDTLHRLRHQFSSNLICKFSVITGHGLIFSRWV